MGGEREELEEIGRDGRREGGIGRSITTTASVGMFTTGELSDMCVLCLTQYVCIVLLGLYVL